MNNVQQMNEWEHQQDELDESLSQRIKALIPHADWASYSPSVNRVYIGNYDDNIGIFASFKITQVITGSIISDAFTAAEKILQIKKWHATLVEDKFGWLHSDVAKEITDWANEEVQ